MDCEILVDFGADGTEVVVDVFRGGVFGKDSPCGNESSSIEALGVSKGGSSSERDPSRPAPIS